MICCTGTWQNGTPGFQEIKKKEINPHWKRRKQNQHHTVGRIRHVPPSMECKELFHFRILLNTVRGPTSFEDLRTMPGETTPCETYHEAAFRRGLVQEDREWDIALEEESSVVMPAQIRLLFVIILTHGLPQNVKVLWTKYRDHMSEDFRHRRTGRHSVDREFTDDDYNDA